MQLHTKKNGSVRLEAGDHTIFILPSEEGSRVTVFQDGQLKSHHVGEISLVLKEDLTGTPAVTIFNKSEKKLIYTSLDEGIV